MACAARLKPGLRRERSYGLRSPAEAGTPLECSYGLPSYGLMHRRLTVSRKIMQDRYQTSVRHGTDLADNKWHTCTTSRWICYEIRSGLLY